MTHLGPQKSGLVRGSLVGGWHLLWAIIVAAGWGQALIYFIFWMHFLKPSRYSWSNRSRPGGRLC